MTKDSNTTAKGYKNAVQSIGYAAAYPAYPLNPPLGEWNQELSIFNREYLENGSRYR